MVTDQVLAARYRSCSVRPPACQASQRPAESPLTRQNINDALYEALFVCELQQSDNPTTNMVAEAITRTMQRFGTDGCAGQMAQEFGDHPDAARDRMRWVRQRPRRRCRSASTA